MAFTFTELFHKTSVGTSADYTSPTFNVAAGTELWIATMGDAASAFSVQSNTGGLTFSEVDFAGPAGGFNYRLHVFKAVVASAQTGMTVTIDAGGTGAGYDVLGFQVDATGDFYVAQVADYDGTATEPATIGTLGSAASASNTTLLFVGINEDGSAVRGALTITDWTPISVNSWSPTANSYYGINAYYDTGFTGTGVTISEWAVTPTWIQGVLVELAEGSPPVYPTVQSTAESATSTAGTSHVITMPSGITGAAGEIVVIVLDKGSTSASFNALTGWTEVVDEASANGITVWVRDTDGTEGASVTFTSSASTRSASIAFRITNAEDPAVQLPQLSTVATGTSTAPNATTCTPTGGAKNYLWITFFGAAGEEADDDTWVNTPSPTGFSPDPPLQKACGTAGTNLGGMIGAAHRQLNAASLDAGAFSIDASSAWRAYTLAVHPAAAGPNDGSASGAISWVGSATGTRTPKGAGNGAISWVGSATGVKPQSGSASGAISWVGSATGVKPQSGSASGAISWVGSATGTRTPKGEASGTISWVGSSTGSRTPKGEATGAISWIGTAVGGNLGVVIGAISWVGSATGTRTPKGDVSGAISWVGSATGETPLVGPNEGTASGAISWVGSVAGTRVSQGSASGGISWNGVAVGGNLGVVLGAISWVGSATGTRTPKGDASGAVSWVGSATGEAPAVGVRDGSADGTIEWVGTATGARASSGEVSGTISWVGSAQGTKHPSGSASGTISWVGIAVGGNLGVAIGAISWVGSATGEAPTIEPHEGSVIGTISWVGSGEGAKPQRGFVVGSIVWGPGVATAIFTIDPEVFLLAPHIMGYIPGVVSSHNAGVIVGHKATIPKGRG